METKEMTKLLGKERKERSGERGGERATTTVRGGEGGGRERRGGVGRGRGERGGRKVEEGNAS